MAGTNYYTQLGVNANVWVKFTDDKDLVDDCELRDTTTLPSDVGVFSQGCTLKVKSTGDQYINIADDGVIPSWSSGILIANVHISASQIQSLNSSPVTLIPAPGLGKYLVGVNLFRKFTYSGVAYVDPGTTNVTINGTNVFQFGTFLAGTSSTVTSFAPNTTYALSENSPMTLTNTTDPTAGTGTLDLIITYQVKSL